MKTLQEKFGARIRELRKSRGMTQEYLSELINIDIPNLSNIERGKKFVSGNTITKIAKAFNVDEKDLFDFGHKKTKEELIKNINNFLENATSKDLEYCYKMITIYKEIPYS
ncbi:helix-turn-helix transcriptional regulator [bacterium]|nr:helix-turn-helix transcriptional regulator [bacterium]